MKLIQKIQLGLNFPTPIPFHERKWDLIISVSIISASLHPFHWTSPHAIPSNCFHLISDFPFFFPWQGFFCLKVFKMQTAELQNLEAPHSSDSSGVSYNRAGVHLPCTHRDGSHPQTAARHSNSNILKSLRG